MINLKVGVCIPTRDVWKADFGQSLSMIGMATLSALPPAVTLGIKVFNKTQCSIPHLARNALVLECLKSECSHIFFLDDDMRFPMNTLAALLRADKDIIAANCVTKEVPPRVTAESKSEKVYTREASAGLERVDSVGTGIMLVKAGVFEKLEMPWFDYEWLNLEEFKKSLPAPGGSWKDVDVHALGVRGEDRYFCNKAREAGFQIWIDHDVSKNVHHIGDWPYRHQMVEGFR